MKQPHNFSDRVRKVLSMAREDAFQRQHDYVGTEHIVLGLLQEGEGVATVVLTNLGVQLADVQAAVEREMKPGRATLGAPNDIPFTTRAKNTLSYAMDESRKLNHRYVGTEHLLLGLVREEKGIAADVLRAAGVTLEKAREETLRLIGTNPESPENATPDGAVVASGPFLGASPKPSGKSTTPAIDMFCRDLTALARDARLDPIVGRTREIDRMVEVLSRRKKNNPVLIGEPGVGKTAVVEGLAMLIASGECPEPLKQKRVMSLDLAAMIAGTKYRGQFEERIKTLMAEVATQKNVILFIDELHTLVGAGGAEGAMDAANMLKPALARGELQCVGASTLNEYRKHIEKDGALERRFQPILIEQPTPDDAVDILRGLRRQYGEYHQVRLPDETLQAAVQLTARYVTDRMLPDKAIDVLDEAAAHVGLTRSEPPAAVVRLRRQLADVVAQKDAAVAAQAFTRAASLREEETFVHEQLAFAESQWRQAVTTYRPDVLPEDVAFVVSRATGIPVTQVSQDDAAKLVQMEDDVHRRVIGQEEAVRAVARAIRRGRAGLKDPKRPTGSFIFCGPTGVGKTELARALARFLFNDEQALIRVDMSEYMERHAVARLVGAPPGYVGYDDGGVLTKAVRRRPYAVILFDEIEKAHPDVFNLLLQVLDEGHLTDSHGRKVDFKNTIIIMTSNAGVRDAFEGKSAGFLASTGGVEYTDLQRKVTEALQRLLNPEFLNRVDDTIVFHPLGPAHMAQILEVLLGDLRKRLTGDHRTLDLTPEAQAFLIEKGSDAKFGARPMKRAIQRYVEDPLAEQVLRGALPVGCAITAQVNAAGDGLELTASAGQFAPA